MTPNDGMERREFLKGLMVGAASLTAMITVPQLTGCGSGGGGTSAGTVSGAAEPVAPPIQARVFTTAQHQILPVALSADTPRIAPREVGLYAKFGYSAWVLGEGLPHEKRLDLTPGYKGTNVARLLTFFSISDIHLTDKESPAQVLYKGWTSGYQQYPGLVATWSPIVVATTHVLDAAIQTVNALHEITPFDFGISLGDDANNTQYNELRWFIDVLDGKVITPSSGAHVGADTIDYQKPYKAAGINPQIPWYQVVGNHDQYWVGSAPENEKTLTAHVGSTILDIYPNPMSGGAGLNSTGAYMGVVDGRTPLGDVILCGPDQDYTVPPTVVPDANRRSLSTSTSTTLNFMREFFNTTSTPVGHGFTQANLDNDFACYSFVPKSDIPIKVIVLDDTCKGAGEPTYAWAALDAPRVKWLTDELQQGQDANQLMIIAAHIPIAPQNTLTDPRPYSAVTHSIWVDPAQEASILALLHTFPNLILWMSGHRHLNVVTPQPSPDPLHPERGFWEVETPSLRDFPQQLRTFDIRRNSDNTLSIIVTNVDPMVSPDSPAAKSRGYAIGAARTYGQVPITSTVSQAYNAELVIPLTPAMQAVIATAGTAVADLQGS